MRGVYFHRQCGIKILTTTNLTLQYSSHERLDVGGCAQCSILFWSIFPGSSLAITLLFCGALTVARCAMITGMSMDACCVGVGTSDRDNFFFCSLPPLRAVLPVRCSQTVSKETRRGEKQTNQGSSGHVISPTLSLSPEGRAALRRGDIGCQFWPAWVEKDVPSRSVRVINVAGRRVPRSSCVLVTPKGCPPPPYNPHL